MNRAELDSLSTQIDRLSRLSRAQNALAKCQRSGDLAGQLQYLQIVADCRLGLAKSPAERAKWAQTHRDAQKIIDESGFQWRGNRLVDPARESERAGAKAKAFGSRVAQFQALRGEIMASLAKAKTAGDRDAVQEILRARDALTESAQAAGLRLVGTRFALARG
ncbi:MAG: hypothetical protein KDD66_13665 [Bdellovibrionales bacterium]|nr:hypothetical protein [Planctomycetales bacterium]MCB0346160.1 hypothetical protein [Bdellovibrionales bacterium]